MEFTLKFDENMPLYKQIEIQIIKAISLGKLQPDDKLPSIRKMAKNLGTNMHTVHKAYLNLKQEGYIYINLGRTKCAVISKNLRVNDFFLKTIREEIQTVTMKAICHNMSREDFVNICSQIFQNIIDQR